MGQRSRKRRRAEGTPATAAGKAARAERQADEAASAEAGPAEAGPARGAGPRGYAGMEARNAAVRASLEPLEPGERPGAVTVAAIVALLMAALNVAAALAGNDLAGDEGNAVVFTVVTTTILVVSAVGMWFARYWAVLGFQVVLGLQIFAFSVYLVAVPNLWQAILVVLYVGLLGTLFWKLIRAMARLQMPERRPVG